ncbi:hypothetical protein VTO42DRAFT_6810 [Malbranchea cinnamomea]
MAYRRQSQHRFFTNALNDADALHHPAPPQLLSESQHGGQYSTASSQVMAPQQSQNPLRRTPSYQTGDDSANFDNHTHRPEDYYTSHASGGRGAGHGDAPGLHPLNSLGSAHSQFSGGSSPHSGLTDTSSSHGSSAVSGYHHHLYQPPAVSSPSQQTSYNPQHFAQPSQPQQPQTGYNPQAFTPTSVTSLPYPTPNHSYQQYNPAAYHSPTSSSFRPSPNSQWQQYVHSPQTSYQSLQSPSSPPPLRPFDANYSGYQTTQAPLGSPGRSTMIYSPNPPPPPHGSTAPPPRSSWSDASTHPTSIPAYAQSASQHSSYNQYPPSPPPPPHGTNPQTQPVDPPNSTQYADPTSSFADMLSATPVPSHRPPSVDSAPAPPIHQNIESSPRRTDTLNRHPQSRPLPGPPPEEEHSEANDGRGASVAELSYEDIMKEVEAAVMEGRPTGTHRQSSRSSRSHHYTPPAEGLSPDEVQTHTNGHGHITSTGTGQYVNYDAYSDDSEAEAAAGMAALRMAEEEEAAMRSRRNTQMSSYSSFGLPPTETTLPPPPVPMPAPPESSDDSDYGQFDMGFYGGGYDVHLHYGDNLVPGQSSGHPVTTSGSFRSSTRSTDERATGSDTHSARVDAVGTGGLAEPSLNPRRLSFDDGDETGLAGSTRTSSIGETPDESEPQDLFFHPGMSSRPLPPPPVAPASSNPIPHLMPAGTYRTRDQQQRQQAQEYDQSGYPLYTGPELNQSHFAAPPVPRSTSLSNHATTPRTTDPLIRSKTDADRLKPRQAGYDSSSLSSSSVAVELLPTIPAGRRKKFNPAKLSTEQFRKCTEPWALSAIVAWVKELSEDETDLKEQAIVDAIVALFTHKVPTMNTADAETLGSRVVKSMLANEVLIKDEEWVKFGPGTMSGVLFQITGQGCYSSRLHVQDGEFFGRCYAHHCMRTLKKINLQAHVMEPEKKAEDWATFYKIGKEVFETHSKKEIDRQNNLHEVVTTEDAYIAQLDVLRTLYRDQLAYASPPIIEPKRLDKFIKEVFGKVDAIKKVNEDYLLAQLKYRQKEQGPWIVGFSDIFREWIRKAKSVYIDYAATFPNANYLMRREIETNLLFRQFLDQARENKMSQRLSWDTFLKAPITRIQRYTLMLSNIDKNMVKESEEKTNLQAAIEEIKLVAMDCDSKVGEMTKKVDLKELSSKLHLRPELKRVVELNLNHLGREIIHQGDLQRPRTKRFNWVDTRAILFDHYLVLAKIVTNRDPTRTLKYETYDVSKLPIPMDLLVLVSTNDDPVMKSSVMGISRVNGPTTPAAAGGGNQAASVTVLENSKEDKILYPFKIKHLGKRDVYTLYAPTAQSRNEWCSKIIEAKTKHAASLHAQNAEPFRLRVLSDSAFAYSETAVTPKGITIKGTPLDRAIREVEKKYEGNLNRPLPICRAAVNCATVFRAPQGPIMCAIGTDYGVYISEYDNPRGWRKAINMLRVTQVAVFEEFNLLLLISDKSLIAYHLDNVCPPNGVAPQSESQRRAPQKLSGNREVGFFAAGRMKDRTLVFYKKREGISSTFKVLEPVLQKSSSSRTRFFPRRGQTEFFREYDEFYIPAESYSINLFHTSLAISTSRGVEVLTLDKKQPWSIPHLRSDQPEAQTHLTSIANRIKDLKPLGMFRLSDSEFLVVFEQCAVYVNKHGDVSRSVVMEFVGHAHSACLYGKYLILFNEDFVEVRNAMNGRLRQVIPGKNVTLLDDGGNNANLPTGSGAILDAAGGHPGLGLSGAGTIPRTVKICMQHPEHERSQIVLELIENERQKD